MVTLPPKSQRYVTLALAAVGTLVFYTLGLPLPFLFGPLAFCLVAALMGAQLRGMGRVSIWARTALGVAVGASITPEVLQQVPHMALSVALIPIYVVLIGMIGVPFFRRLGFDQATSYYAAMPGGIGDMVIFGQEAGADPRALSLIHATRMTVIITLAPLILTHFYNAPLTEPIGEPVRDLPISELLLMVAAAIVGWKGGQRIGLIGAAILGPLIVTAALSLAGFIHYRPPAEAIQAAQFLIGIGIGVQYVGVTMRELRLFVQAGLAFVLILAALTAVFVEAVTMAGLAPPVEAFLAFAPGGQAEMTLIALVVGADLGFVVLHHVTRMILVIMGAPIAARLFGLRRLRTESA